MSRRLLKVLAVVGVVAAIAVGFGLPRPRLGDLRAHLSQASRASREQPRDQSWATAPVFAPSQSTAVAQGYSAPQAQDADEPQPGEEPSLPLPAGSVPSPPTDVQPVADDQPTVDDLAARPSPSPSN